MQEAFRSGSSIDPRMTGELDKKITSGYRNYDQFKHSSMQSPDSCPRLDALILPEISSVEHHTHLAGAGPFENSGTSSAQ